MKKFPAFLACASLVMLSPQVVVVTPAHGAPTEEVKTPSQDAIWDESGVTSDLDSNYVGYSGDSTYGVQKSAIQFDLTGVAGNVSQAKLRIYVTDYQDLNEGDAYKSFVTIIGSTVDTWGPVFPAQAGDEVLHANRLVPANPGTLPENDRWMEFDVTDFVQSEMSSNKIVTFGLTGQENKDAVQFGYASDDYADASKHPQLVLTIGPAAANAPVVTNATTAEDTKSNGGLVISPNAADSNVTHYKISGITGGTLYKQNGTTVIGNGDFITAAEGSAGLKFTPNANENSGAGGVFTFDVQAAQDNAGTGLSPVTQANITVTEVNDAPSGVNDTLSDISEDSGDQVIPFSALISNDSKGNSYENGQTLTVTSVGSATGGTVRIDGANVIFSPTPDYHGPAGFQYTLEDNGTTNGAADAKTAQATASFTILPAADTPGVTNAVTAEDTQSTGGLVITPNAVDGAAVTHFKISGITGGTLYKNNGTTLIPDGGFITAAEAGAGLKFTPAANANSAAGDTFSFQVQAALDSAGTGLSTAAQATVTVTEVNDAPTGTDDSLTDMAEDADERSIPFAALLSNDTAGPGNESGQALTIKSVGSATGGTVRIEGMNVIFTPSPEYHGAASFQYTLEDNGTTNGAAAPKTAQATANFAIGPVADTPGVTTASTTEDTQSTSGLVIARNAVDGSEVTHFKISGITGGTLYKNDGSTSIQNGDFITAAEGGAGLKFTPAANANTLQGDAFTFQVQAALSSTGTGLSPAAQATLTVSEVNDTPQAADDALPTRAEDDEEFLILTSDLLANDTAGPVEENGQQLAITSVGGATGGTVRLDGTNVYFTPTPNYNGAASFQYTVEDNGTTNGVSDAKTDTATVSFVIDSVADTPSVTGAVTAEDGQTSSGLVITKHAADGADVTHFKISGITGGTLYKNDGSTPIQNGDFITAAEGGAGLKFSPAANANTVQGDAFTFNVQAALSNTGTGLSAAAQATVTVSEVNDEPVAADDVLTSMAENASERTIPLADLAANDEAGPANESSQTLTLTAISNPVGGTIRSDGTNAYFTPTPNYRGAAGFTYTVTDDGTTNGVLSPKTDTAVISFMVDARSDAPTVTNAQTPEDVQSTSDLVITPTAAGGATATYFRISGITGGTLYQHDGMTQIQNGEYITVSEGGAGLKFTPDADQHGTTGFGFNVQAAPGTDGALLSDAVPASITVTEVNDAPVASEDTLVKVAVGTPNVTVPFSSLLGNDLLGPTNEQAQELTIIDVKDPVGGTVSITGDQVEFVPDANFRGVAKFTYTVQDDGLTDGMPDPKTDTADVQFNVVDEDQPVITLHGDSTVYVLKGQPYQEPGYAADDETDHDLTGDVMVTGAVNTNVLGTYQLRYNVADSSGNAAPEAVRTVHVVSNELAALTVQAGTLQPVFSPGHENYTLSVPVNSPKLTLTVNPLDPTASVTINGQAAGNGGTHTINLRANKNDIELVVTAQGGATKTYHLEANYVPPVTPPSKGSGPKVTPPSNVRQAKVDTKITDSDQIVQVDINRTEGTNGTAIDSVVMSGAKADEVVRHAAANGGTVARIIIDDLPEQPADEVTVSISGAALGKMNSAGLGLVIEASEAKISLAADTLSQMGLNGEDLYFRVVPIRQPDAAQQVAQRIAQSKVIQEYAQDTPVQIVSQPMTIDTNYSSRRTKVMLPLNGMEVPSDPKERDAFLSNLAVYVEHSDGEKVVQRGNVVYDAAGKPIGLEIEVQKFSTFTIISAESQTTEFVRYISGYPDGTFRPTESLTRAELASILANQLKLGAEVGAQVKDYPDLDDSHWAWNAIQKLTAAGILTGDTNGDFRPEQPVKRAELALIAAKLKQTDAANLQANFPDASDHWAAAAIAAVKQLGLMSGFADGSFRPDQPLTRAEAVIVVNRLFERPLLTDAEQSSWPDVTLGDWYAPDVESASNDLRKLPDGKIEKK